MTNLQTDADKLTASWEMVSGFVCLFAVWGIYVSVYTFSRWWVLVINSILHAAVWYRGKLSVWSSSCFQIHQQSSCGISHTYHPSPARVIGLLYSFE